MFFCSGRTCADFKTRDNDVPGLSAPCGVTRCRLDVGIGILQGACLKIARGAAARSEPDWPPQQSLQRSSDDQANAAHSQKTRRPEGFRANGRLASLLLSRRPTRGILLRRVSPSSPLPKNSTPRNLQAGS